MVYSRKATVIVNFLEVYGRKPPSKQAINTPVSFKFHICYILNFIFFLYSMVRAKRAASGPAKRKTPKASTSGTTAVEETPTLPVSSAPIFAKANFREQFDSLRMKQFGQSRMVD